MTITEALAEIKLITKKVDQKRNQIRTFLYRQEMLKDPLAKDGGSEAYIGRESQAISDLEGRLVALRIAIAYTNSMTPVTVNGVTHTIAEWLVWRREVAPKKLQFFITLRSALDQVRREAQSRGARIVDGTSATTAATDYIINVDEAQLGRETEKLNDILAMLDGQLSMLNATTQIATYE